MGDYSEKWMKSLLILLLLITPLYYVRAHPIEAEHGGDHDDDNHISAKSGEEHAEIFEKKEVVEDAAEADSDIDPVENEVVEDVEDTHEEGDVEEAHEEGDICEDETVKENEEKDDDGEETQENNVEKTTVVTTATSTSTEAEHKVEKRAAKTGHGHRLSDKHQIQTRDKRSTEEDSEDAYEELNRRQRSAESDEDEEDKSLLEHGEYHGHAERKRRDTSGSEEEEGHNLLKRHIGHHILAHEHNRIGDPDAVHYVHRHEDASELPHFASDAVKHVDSVAVRVKRVSRAGSSHKGRVMHTNRGNSRAGQNETGIEDEQNITSI